MESQQREDFLQREHCFAWWYSAPKISFDATLCVIMILPLDCTEISLCHM
jgi:hypothetical protein